MGSHTEYTLNPALDELAKIEKKVVKSKQSKSGMPPGTHLPRERTDIRSVKRADLWNDLGISEEIIDNSTTLTPLEKQVAHLVLQNFSSEKIADRLGIGDTNNISKYIKKILTKLGKN